MADQSYRESDADFALQELRHRMRNNLAAISGLLRLQARQCGNAEASEALQSAADRVVAFVEINTSLDETHTGNSSIRTLLDRLARSIGQAMIGSRSICICIEADDLTVPARIATGLGLIANELVTNALKHAFPDDRAGTIRISVAQRAAGIVLSVEDDGVGASAITAGFGLSLVEHLVDRMKGSMERCEDDGVMWRIIVPAA